MCQSSNLNTFFGLLKFMKKKPKIIVKFYKKETLTLLYL